MFLTSSTRIFAIVLNYRTAPDTLRCIASLRRSRARSIFPVVVDNASGDDEVERLAHHLGPASTIIEAPENLGYAGGNNLGIRHSLERDADFVWILNPDTEVETTALQRMVDTMRAFPEVGFVGSLNLFGGSSPPQIQSAGGMIDWERGITDSIGLGKPLSSLGGNNPRVVDYVAGTSMLVRRQVFDDVGMLPERYFMYFEETDFQVRARRAGWKSIVDPLARVWHHQRSTGQLPAPYYIYYYIRGRLLFGKEFSTLTDEELIAGLDGFIGGWRSRVEQRAPDWLETYDRLTRWAIEDGRSGVGNRRDDVHAIDRPEPQQ